MAAIRRLTHHTKTTDFMALGHRVIRRHRRRHRPHLFTRSRRICEFHRRPRVRRQPRLPRRSADRRRKRALAAKIKPNRQQQQ